MTDPLSAVQALTQMGIPFSFFRHQLPVTSLEQAAQERGLEIGQIIRTLVFRISQDQFFLVLVAGGLRVNWARLRRHFGQSRLTLASEQEVKAVTGCLPGGVSPFGLPAPLPVLVDRSVLEPEILSLGAGERGASVILKREDLFKALGEITIGDFCAK